MKKKKSTKGVITVLVSLMMVGILSVTTLVLEGGRFQAAKTQLGEANISASTSVIAAYHSDLYGKYGLLGFDMNDVKLDRVKDYVAFNSDMVSGANDNKLGKLYTVKSVEVQGLYNLTYPDVLKRQILTRAKYHVVPQNYALNVYNMDSFFADFQRKCLDVADALTGAANGSAQPGSVADISPEMLSALTALYAAYLDAKTSDPQCDVTLSSSSVSILPSKTGTVSGEADPSDVTSINNSLNNAYSVLGGSAAVLSYQNGSPVNEIDVNVNVSFIPQIKTKLADVSTAPAVVQDTHELAEQIRTLAQRMNSAVNMLNTSKESTLLLNAYISEYFSNRNYQINTYSGPDRGVTVNGTMSNATFASACTEYVFGGEASEKNNQDIAYQYVMAIRLINNLYSVLSDSTTFNANNYHSVAAHIAWAYYESEADLQLLTQQNVPVPFNKNNAILPVNNAAGVAAAYTDTDSLTALNRLGFYTGTTFEVPGSYAFSYKDSLMLGLWFVPNSQKLLRIADLIQLEMRYHQQYVDNETADFLMSNCNTYCKVQASAEFSSILPVLSLGTTRKVNGMEFRTIKFSGY